MPTRTIQNIGGAPAVVDAIADLEADGHRVVAVAGVGDQTLIVYEKPPVQRAQRQPKSEQETRS